MKTLTIKYFLREDRKLDNGNIPIYARIILDREKFEMSTKQWLADTWAILPLKKLRNAHALTMCLLQRKTIRVLSLRY